MASGINHVKGTILITLPVAMLAASMGAGTPGALACGAGCLAGVYLSPDLDIPSRTHSEYLVYRHLGRFLGALWFAFWWLYARLVPHRSPWSHAPLIGTFGRVLYVYIFGGLLWFGISFALTGTASWMPLDEWLQSPLFSWCLLGLALADGLHYVMDFLPFWR